MIMLARSEGGLKVAIHATGYCLQKNDANPDLHSLLKLDVHNTFSERNWFVIIEAASQNYLDGPSGAISFLHRSDLVRDVFFLMQSVQQVDPLEPLLFFLVLVEFFDQIPLTPGIFVLYVIFRQWCYNGAWPVVLQFSHQVGLLGTLFWRTSQQEKCGL